MKKSLLVLAIASTLAACGGGGGGTGTTPTTTNKNYGEIYFSDQGGMLNIGFQPNQLPDWIKNNNGQYTITSTECTNRSIELSGSQGSATVIQSSKYSCELSDYAGDANFLNFSNWTETAVDSSQRIFTNSILDSRFSRVSGLDWPKKRGLNQIKMQVSNGDCRDTDCTRPDPRERTEIAFNLSSQNSFLIPDPTREYWISFSFYVPKPYNEQGNQLGTNQELTIFQIMSTQEYNGIRSWNPFLMVGKKYNGNFTATTWVNDFQSKDRTINNLIEDNNFEGYWHDVLVKYKSSLGNPNQAGLEIWINGIKKVDFFGRTVDSEKTEIYFKLGLYRPKDPKNTTQEIYFDEVRVGNTRAEVDLR